VSHVYGVYDKMHRKARTVQAIHDLVGLRVIVEKVADCYLALRVVHSLWDPILDELDDYVEKPKDNGYQSLHTALLVQGKPGLEVQIRTQDMHEFAEHGAAAHWRYKNEMSPAVVH
jgi:GTP pyrophosphokinase